MVTRGFSRLAIIECGEPTMRIIRAVRGLVPASPSHHTSSTRPKLTTGESDSDRRVH
jgi:hypothetical protein